MSMHEYKAALKSMIDATDDEAILERWKTQIEKDYEQYRQQRSTEQQASSDSTGDKDQDEGYVILESGLGIDE